MKAELDSRFELCRVVKGALGSDGSYGPNGVFIIPFNKKIKLYIIASNNYDWDHVSVSVAIKQRTPTWAEMCFVKDIFFEPNEVAIQYHPPWDRYINYHPFVLHMWRPQRKDLPYPPEIFV